MNVLVFILLHKTAHWPGLCPFLYQYKFRDVAIEELQKFHRIFPEMIPSTGTYSELFWRPQPFVLTDVPRPWLFTLLISAFTDSTQKDLLKLIGNLPVQYEGRCEPWHQRVSIETVVHWQQLLRHQAAPTTSLFSSGCWTPSPSLLPSACWDPLPTWSSGRANTWMPEDGSSCRDCKTGIT